MPAQLVDDDRHSAQNFWFSGGRNVPLVVNENSIQQGRNKVFSYLIERGSRGYTNAATEPSHTVYSKVCCLVTGDAFPKEAGICYPSINSSPAVFPPSRASNRVVLNLLDSLSAKIS